VTDVIKHVRVGNLLPVSDTSWEAANIKVEMAVVEIITTATMLAVSHISFFLYWNDILSFYEKLYPSFRTHH
jgi:hypothetical protein